MAIAVPAASASGTIGNKYTYLTGSDTALGDGFGNQVGVSGTTAIFGAQAHNSDTGAAYVFLKSLGKWTQQEELVASDAATGDQFGSSVAIYGDTAVVGAPSRSSGRGAVYVFVRSGSAWTQTAELTASDAQVQGRFGASVAISSGAIVVGSYGYNTYRGAAYVFTGSGSSWQQAAELTAPDGAQGDYFGFAVASEKGVALIGAESHNSGAGAAYVFAGSSWGLQAELTVTSTSYFGASVALSGATAVVGALGGGSQTGAAYVFGKSGSNWSQLAELSPSDGAAGDQFGDSVALAGENILVGANGHSNGYGAAYVFSGSGSTWNQAEELADPTSAKELKGGFGQQVALSGTTAVISDGSFNHYAGRGVIVH